MKQETLDKIAELANGESVIVNCTILTSARVVLDDDDRAWIGAQDDPMLPKRNGRDE